MRSKKVIALLISLTLLVSSVLPGTLAVSIDQDTARSSVTLTSGKQETPTPAPEGTETLASVDKPVALTETGNALPDAEDTFEWVAGKIRIKINVKLVDADGTVKNAPAGVPVEVRRLLSGAYANKEGWTDQLVLFTGESDKNGVVYIDAEYRYTIDEQNKIAIHLNRHLHGFDSAITNCQRQISLLQERKQIIINEVVTGKVKVS